jgi:hypothetical protein
MGRWLTEQSKLADLGSGNRTGAEILLSVAADRLDRATFHCLLAERLFLGGRGLFKNVRMPAIIVAGEVRRRSLATQIAIDALIVDVELSCYVLRVFICNICHIGLDPYLVQSIEAAAKPPSSFEAG